MYGELRELIFERLYRFHVQVSRLELVLQVGWWWVWGEVLGCMAVGQLRHPGGDGWHLRGRQVAWSAR